MITTFIRTERNSNSLATKPKEPQANAGWCVVRSLAHLPTLLLVLLSSSAAEFAPAPRTDRVGFPKEYRTTFKVLGGPARTNVDPSMVLTAYGNDLAASLPNAAPLPYPNGSIIVMEFAEALKDSAGKPLLDENGRPQKGNVQRVDVMRRGEGFGEAYGASRSGEWEFAGYHLDGTYSTPPAKSASCAQCHQKAGAARDFVFPLKAIPTGK